MSLIPVVHARGLGGTRFRRTAASRLIRLVTLAAAAGITTAALASCSGTTDGSASSGEGAVGAAGAAAGSSSAARAEQPYKTIGPVGSEPGELIIKPATGSTSVSPTWSTTDACPVGYQTSAQLYAVIHGGGDLFTWISGTLNPGNNPIPAGQGLQFGDTVQQVQIYTKTPNGQTDKWVVRCSALNSGFGDREYVQSVFIHFSADGKSYTTSAS
jgi:hypothetical protein